MKTNDNASHPKPMQPHGLLICSIARSIPSSSIQHLAPLPSRLPDNRPNKALGASQQKLKAHQNKPNHLFAYF
jgi:hypothetical protein